MDRTSRRMIRTGGRLCLLLVLLAAGGFAAAALKNQLKNHPSPYLALHGNDPVAWQDWGPHVFALARRQNKLIYVSIGYFSCHWCHVMQRESYQNKQIARYLNEHYIPVKVDRELHPALDTRLLEFIQATNGYSGWPANVFVTPEGHPLAGFVYVKPKQFLAKLKDLNAKWTANSGHWKAFARRITKALNATQKKSAPAAVKVKAAELLQGLTQAALKAGDDLRGGFGQKAKFPNVPQLLALMDAQVLKPQKKLKSFLLLTLDQMASQGLRDHLRGGFFRYTVDTQWQTPHFEKMLYDNAQLVELYLLAAKRFQRPDYEQVARSTLDFMLRELRDPSGAMIASLSAIDSNNVEGGYYLWHDTQLKQLLNKQEYRVVRLAWGMEHAPVLSHGHLPVKAMSVEAVAAKLGLPARQVRKAIASARRKLLEAQRKRRLPKDDKLLAGWNGMALRALSLGAALPGGQKYRQAARRIRDYLVDTLWDGKRLLRAKSARGRFGYASLEDYAHVAYGLYTWASYHQRKDLQVAQAIARQGWQRFYGPQGWRLAEKMLIGLGGAEEIISDAAIASPSAILIRTTLALGRKLRQPGLDRKARQALYVAQQTLRKEPYWFATHIRTLYAFEHDAF